MRRTDRGRAGRLQHSWSFVLACRSCLVGLGFVRPCLGWRGRCSWVSSLGRVGLEYEAARKSLPCQVGRGKLESKSVIMMTDAQVLNVRAVGSPPRRIAGWASRESPRRSSSRPPLCAAVGAADCDGPEALKSPRGSDCTGTAAGCISSGPPRSIRESSLPGPVATPAPLVPNVPLGICCAASYSPFFVKRYLFKVR